MAVREFTAAPSWGGSTANLRSECKKISDAIKGVGLVQTADTGQIDFAAVVASTATNGLHGYEIFRLGDGSLGLPIIYMRIEYRNASYTSGYAGIGIQIGTGTDGAGNLTGNTSYQAREGGSTNYTNNTAQQSCQMASDGSTYFWMQVCDNVHGQAIPLMVLVLDRARNADGTASPDGVMFMHQRHPQSGSNKITNSMCVNLKAGMSNSVHSEPLQTCLFVGHWNTLTFGNDMYFFPHYFANPMVYAASPIILGHMASEVTYGTKPVVSVYGVDRTFFSLGTRAGGWSARYDQNHGVMLRWDV